MPWSASLFRLLALLRAPRCSKIPLLGPAIPQCCARRKAGIDTNSQSLRWPWRILRRKRYELEFHYTVRSTSSELLLVLSRSYRFRLRRSKILCIWRAKMRYAWEQRGFTNRMGVIQRDCIIFLSRQRFIWSDCHREQQQVRWWCRILPYSNHVSY